MPSWEAITGVSTALTAAAAGAAAVFAGLTWWFSVRTPRPLVEARATGRRSNTTEVELTIENRAAHHLRFDRVSVEDREDVGIAASESDQTRDAIIAMIKAEGKSVAEINCELPPRQITRSRVFLVSEAKGRVTLALHTVRLTNPGRPQKATVIVDLV